MVFPISSMSAFKEKNHEGYLFIFTVTIRRMRGHWNEVCLGLKQVTEYFLDLLWLTGRWQGHWSEVSSLYNSLIYFLGFSKRDINISCDKTRLSSEVFGFTIKHLLDFLRLTRKMREHWSEVSWNSAPLLWKLALCAQQTSILLSDANIQRYLENIHNTFLSLQLHIFSNLCIPRNCKMSQKNIIDMYPTKCLCIYFEGQWLLNFSRFIVKAVWHEFPRRATGENLIFSPKHDDCPRDWCGYKVDEYFHVTPSKDCLLGNTLNFVRWKFLGSLQGTFCK